jgi:hypothetical protein
MVDRARLRLLNAGCFPVRRRAAPEAKPRRLEHAHLVEQLTRNPRTVRAHAPTLRLRDRAASVGLVSGPLRTPRAQLLPLASTHSAMLVTLRRE